MPRGDNVTPTRRPGLGDGQEHSHRLTSLKLRIFMVPTGPVPVEPRFGKPIIVTDQGAIGERAQGP